MNGASLAAIVDAARPVLITVLFGVSVAACGRNAPDQAESGAAVPPGSTAGSLAGTPGSGPSYPSPSSSGSASASSIGTKIDDSVITTKVKAALMADGDIKGTDISVETAKGEVTLSGFVDSDAQIGKAVKVAQRMDGVKAVNNKMTVKK